MRVTCKRYILPRHRLAMTLVEIMVVVAIMGMIAAVVAKVVTDHLQQAKVELARTEIREYSEALELFYIDNDFYPSTSQGLKALVEKPTTGEIPKKYPPNGYLKNASLLDPWKHEYKYICPGAFGDFDMISLGRDGQEDGEGFDADIKSWDLDGSGADE